MARLPLPAPATAQDGSNPSTALLWPTPPLRRHPALASSPRAVFNPDAVGRVQGYPSTPEAFAARCDLLRANSARARSSGKATRRGVPNGFRGRREEVERLRQEAEVEAV